MRRNDQAFSLLECLCVILIVIIISTLSICGYQLLAQSQQLTQYRRQIVQGLRYARRQALIQSEEVTYCGSSNATQCDGAWSRGQLVVASNKVLRTFPHLAKHYELDWLGSLKSSNALHFTRRGILAGPGSFYLRYHQREIRITVNRLGRVR